MARAWLDAPASDTPGFCAADFHPAAPLQLGPSQTALVTGAKCG